jgi:hypothetical protein
MRTNTAEAIVLSDRLQRLQAIVEEAGRDAGAVSRHEAVFLALVATLHDADSRLAVFAGRSRVSGVLHAQSDAAELSAIQRALSVHVAELTAALQAETLVSVRAIHDVVSRREALSSSSDAAEAAAAAAAFRSPPPPFSMSFQMSDFLFDPPLQTQMATAARGSFGVVVVGVWRAHSIAVAVKILLARGPGGEQFISIMSWLAEAESMRRLREHGGGTGNAGGLPRNVVLLYGIGAQEDGNGVSQYLVVMERMGGCLRDVLDGYLAANRQPALSRALGWLLEMALGVAECHEARVVHGDIKAANVLLAERTREAKLGDLGMARVSRGLSDTLSKGTARVSGNARGSPLWVAPELVEDPDVLPGPATDVYAWAVTAWEVLTCRYPYHSAEGVPTVNIERLQSRLDLVSGKLRPDLTAVRADAPPRVVALVARAWASEPRERPTADALVREMRAVVEGGGGGGTPLAMSSPTRRPVGAAGGGVGTSV